MSKKNGADKPKTTATLSKRLAALERKVSGNPTNVAGGKAPTNLRHLMVADGGAPRDAKAILRKFTPNKVISPYAHAFLEYAEDPLEKSCEFEGKLIKMPMNNGEIPCKSMVVRRGARHQFINTSGASGDMNFWFTPQGIYDNTEGQYTFNGKTVGSTSYSFGPVTNQSSHPAVFGYMAGTAVADDANDMALSPSGNINLAGYQGLDWNLTENTAPYQFTNGTENSQRYRLVAFGVQIEYSGEVQVASGSCIMGQMYDIPTDSSLVKLVKTKTDGCYKEVQFSNKRSVRMAYKVTCDAPEWTVNNWTGAGITHPYSRMGAGVFNLPNGSGVIVTAFATYELVNPDVVQYHTSGYTAPDALHIKNAVVDAFSSNEKLVHHVVRHKMLSHPLMSKIYKAGETGLAMVGGYEGLATLMSLF